ncbi:hypothetical protein CDAR_394241 [Caerostris darwini]|uniref:Uncharacterized protein n=1 Tax=Caerostris darwini TaxID=1538125 RepID=A0AAV4RJ55_9ARAC|nr:hypothetical protein CDAR_394241 [Caerostris darwini]
MTICGRGGEARPNEVLRERFPVTLGALVPHHPLLSRYLCKLSPLWLSWVLWPFITNFRNNTKQHFVRKKGTLCAASAVRGSAEERSFATGGPELASALSVSVETVQDGRTPVPAIYGLDSPSFVSVQSVSKDSSSARNEYLIGMPLS